MNTTNKFKKLFNRALNKALLNRELWNAGAIVKVSTEIKITVDKVLYYIKYRVIKSDPVFKLFGYNKNEVHVEVVFCDSRNMCSGIYKELDFIPERFNEMSKMVELTDIEKEESLNGYNAALMEMNNLFRI